MLQARPLDSESRVVVASRPRTLVLVLSPDIMEAALLGPTGVPLAPSTRLPCTADPATSFAALWPALEAVGELDRVSVLVKPGVTWSPLAVTRELEQQCGRPVRMSTYADLRWRGVIARAGVELVLALGDELESALFFNGVHVPGLALGRHRFRKGRSYDEYMSPAVREKKGLTAWNRRIGRVVDEVQCVFNPARLYIAVPRGVVVLLTKHPAARIVPMPDAFEGALSLWD